MKRGHKPGNRGARQPLRGYGARRADSPPCSASFSDSACTASQSPRKVSAPSAAREKSWGSACVWVWGVRGRWFSARTAQTRTNRAQSRDHPRRVARVLVHGVTAVNLLVVQAVGVEELEQLLLVGRGNGVSSGGAEVTAAAWESEKNIYIEKETRGRIEATHTTHVDIAGKRCTEV